jgi:ATP-dependent helicase/nuclease subunit B
LRVEQYRQTMQQYLNNHDNVFFKKSFLADPLAAAEALLFKRDELLLNDFDFELTDKMPERLRVISALEKGLDLLPNFFHPGYADRFSKVMEYLNEDISIPIHEIQLTEPLSLVPPHLQRLFNKISKKGINIRESAQDVVEGDSDLSMFKKSLITKGITRTTAKADGSLLILRAGSETYAAAYLSKLFSKNSNFRPLCLISNKNRALDNAIIQEGLPSFGVLSASLSRPTLQILKLAPVFLWTPLNPYKLLEFLSLPNIPLPRGLAFRLAAAVSEKPGLFSNVWFGKKNDFFNDLDAKIEAAEKKSIS